MRLTTAYLFAAGAVAAAASTYVLDPNWPTDFSSLNVSKVTAVAVAVGADGVKEVHVAQRGTALPFILVYAVNGTLIRTWGQSNVVSPHGLFAVPPAGSGLPSTLWVTDVGAATVKLFGIDTSLLATIGTAGHAGSGIDPAQFSEPADVTVIAAQGNVLVSDGDGGINNRVLVFQSDGGLYKVQQVIGGGGSAPGNFSSPHSIAYHAPTDSIWVADRGNNRLQAFNASTFGVLGEWTSGCFNGGSPWGVRVDARRGIVAVADGQFGKLYVLQMPANGVLGACQLLQEVDVGVARVPHELDIDYDTGDIYLAGVGTVPTIQRYTISS